jgi:dihydrofolate synthase / folylpolyglutamate synthase
MICRHMATRSKARRTTSRRGTPAVVVGRSTKKGTTARRANESKRRPEAGKSAGKRSTRAAVIERRVIPAPLSPFQRALRFLATLADYEKLRIVRYNAQNFSLDRMRALLKKMGNPQDTFRSVHIAGTKGKGSTCAMTASMLQACGYKVGVYTSPHLIDIRERITINGEMISEADFGRLIRSIQPIATKLKPPATYFDVLTAAAFKYFAEQKVEIAIIETGLGGRLDSTNVLKPEVTAVTSISRDHMQQLGNTLSAIAREKAGIFKPGIPAVTVQQAPEVEAVLKQVASDVGAPLDITGKSIEFSYRFESSRLMGPHNRICLSTPNSKFEHLAVPLMGEHQAINCGLALSIIDRLKTRGLAINDNAVMEGLEQTQVPGRMEMVSQTPRVLVDGAHNAASLDAMLKAIGQHIPYDSMVVIFGCCSDKDVPGMLERITAGADKVIFTRVNNIRSADPNELAATYTELYGKMAQVAPTLEDALAIANRAVTKEDLICITGSFYLVGEAKKHFAAKAAAKAMLTA